MTQSELAVHLVEVAWEQGTLSATDRCILSDVAEELGWQELAEALRAGNRWVNLLCDGPWPVLLPYNWSVHGHLSHALLIHLAGGDL